ncbi:MAG: PBSX family phage terminase large subunit, partial [Chitinophagaceae bacterium]|nr:PBSX family phage terminase large subunit [Chitinophagaceae bacterium]
GIRKVGNTLRDSVIPSFWSRMDELGCTDEFVFNKTDRTLTHKEHGSQIIFRGLDDPDKLKSFEGLTRILVEEAAELEFEDFMELNRRARGRQNIQITLTFNPIDEQHWLKKHFFDRDDPDATIIHSTYKNNNHLTEEDRKQIEQISLYNNNQYRIYALGEWGVLTNDRPWLYTFEKEKHASEELTLLRDHAVYLSFDFNRNPLTCLAVQMSDTRGTKNSFIHFINEFSGSYTLEELCRHISSTYSGVPLFVTGDASGRRGDISMTDKHGTYYSMIQSYLDLKPRQMHIFSHNITHNDSMLLVNTLFAGYPRLRICSNNCPLLINDCITARIDDKSDTPGSLKKDRKAYKMDLFDAMRYFFQRYFSDFSGSVVLGKKAA